MSCKWAIADGEWFDPTIWNDGVVPGGDDDVYANGRRITIHGHATSRSIRTKAVPDIGVVAGGQFLVESGSVLGVNGHEVKPGLFLYVEVANVTAEVIEKMRGLGFHTGNVRDGRGDDLRC